MIVIKDACLGLLYEDNIIQFILAILLHPFSPLFGYLA